MSLSVVPQQCYRVIDPRMDYTGEAYYAVPQGAKKVLFSLQTSQGSSSSVQQYNFFTPNPETILSRRVLWRNTLCVTLNARYYNYGAATLPTTVLLAYPLDGAAPPLPQFPVNATQFQLGASMGLPIQLGVDDAPRPYAAHLFCQTMNANLNNNCQVTTNPSDIIDAMTHVNGRALYRGNDMTAWFPDNGPYESISNTTSRNPMGTGENWQWDYARGATLVNILAVTYTNATGASSIVTSQMPMDYGPAAPLGGFLPFNVAVQWTTTEALMMSPFTWVCDGAGFRGLQSMNFNFAMLGNAAGRLWSHRSKYAVVAYSPGNVDYIVSTVCTNPIMSVDAGNTIPSGGGQGLFTAPTLLLEYLYPPLTINVPRITTVPYRELTRYPMGTFSFASQSSITVPSAQLQLPLIPEMVIVYARRDNATRESTAPYGPTGLLPKVSIPQAVAGGAWSCSAADIFLPITNINIQWNVSTGLLSTAQPEHLYEMSKRNGVDLPYTAWTGAAASSEQVFAVTRGGPPTAAALIIKTGNQSYKVMYRVPTVGSILALRFGYEIPLDEGQAPGLRGTWNWMMSSTFAANGPTRGLVTACPNATVPGATSWLPSIPQSGAIPPVDGSFVCGNDSFTMYNVFVFPGTVTLQPMLTTKDIGVLTNSDIVSAGVKSNLPMSAIRPPMGGDFLGSMFERLRDGMGNMGDLAQSAIKKAMAFLPSMSGMASRFMPGAAAAGPAENLTPIGPLNQFDSQMAALNRSAEAFKKGSSKLRKGKNMFGQGMSGGDMTGGDMTGGRMRGRGMSGGGMSGGDMTGGRMAPPGMLRSRLQQFMG